MHVIDRLRLEITRRHFFSRSSHGIGTAALVTLLNPSLRAEPGEPGADTWRGVVDPLHGRPSAKRIIWLYMAGGPSHLETFDHKPKLAEMHGKRMPESFTTGQPIAQLQGQHLRCLGPQHPFRRHGASGQEISSVFPHIATIADRICIVRSMVTEQINHDPAHTFMNTGATIPGRPSMGSWLTYGLGSDSDNLPGFVVLTSSGGGQDQPIAARQWHSGFLPGRFQGVPFQSSGDPVLYAGRPPGVSSSEQERVVRTVQKLHKLGHEVLDDPEMLTRISQYEMAFRMQTSVPELVDFSSEPEHVLNMYGTRGADGSFAANCLLARRLAERGVRFIQCYHRGWDHHGGVRDGSAYTGKLVDQASAALVRDLEQRGMLEDTLVVWGGEFGRTPMAQGDGRDHHIKGFSLWMAGGGVRGGITYGSTDELGYNALPDQRVHVHDFHATALHLLGIDHERLVFPFQGRNFRLTDVAGKVVAGILS
ncbi:MAG TPA: DUF1501 domain-containing protein [Verrucomicrobiales bacterium]|nr:DUF1501 domain-containing protein [Verrucomicrobiales bacterium]